MGTEEEKINQMFQEELAKIMNVNRITEFPATIRVEQDILPDLERWRKDE